MSTLATHEIAIRTGDATMLAPVMTVMAAAFDPTFGEAWTGSQCSGMLGGIGAWLLLAERRGEPAGFALVRAVAGEAELLLIASHPRGQGIGAALLDRVIKACRARGVARLFLEVRACNPAISLYRRAGFVKVGERRGYYRGRDGNVFDAHSYSLAL